MSSNTSIILVNNDFDSFKSSLITYLGQQEKFKDYDFTGSNIQVLLDILSYNTFHNTFFLNMAISEGFLDSAQLTSSVLSHSRELNYVPRSARSALARVGVSFTAVGTSQPYLVQKGESFSTMIKAGSFIFSIPETLIVSSANNSFYFETDIYEGIYVKDSFIYLNTLDIQTFRLTNSNVDIESITVTVYDDGSIYGQTYTYTDTLLDLNELSTVYFLQAVANGQYEIVFGDGVIGKSPKYNSTIIVDYRLSNGDGANGARNFVINFDPTGASGELTSSPVVNLIAPATNGAPEESINSIKFYAPRHFQIQDRAIIPSDYELLLKKEFPEINAISAIGGEDAMPPVYGKVFISVNISDVIGLPLSKKQQYTNYLKGKGALIPVFLPANFTYVSVKSTVNYNYNIFSETAQRIQSLVTAAITQYNTDNLNDFKVTLRYSKFISEIDSCDTSIISNETKLRVYKKIQPNVGSAQNIVVNFGISLADDLPDFSTSHPITEYRTIFSTLFTYAGQTCFLEDDGTGNVRISKQENDTASVVVNVGTIDYTAGLISLVNFNIDAYQGDFLKIYAVTAESDIAAPQNNILLIEPDEIAITAVAIRE